MSTDVTLDQADRELLYQILYTLKEGNDDQRDKAVKELLPKLRNKLEARARLTELLGYSANPEELNTQQYKDYEQSYREYYGGVRSWAATALAELFGSKDGEARSAIKQRLEKENEPVPRYWMLFALYRMSPAEEIKALVDGIVSNYIEFFKSDRDTSFEGQGPDNARVGPLALAIQASWKNQQSVQFLEARLKSQDFYSVWSVCRALELVSCREMLEPLRQKAQDPTTWTDIRNKCVKALGRIESPTAARALGQVLAEVRDPIIKESAIEGLEYLGQSILVRSVLSELEKIDGTPYSVADSLMVALLDSNAQIRHRAAEALPKVMIDPTASQDGGGKVYKEALTRARISATEKVVDELVRETVDLEKGVPTLVDALRVIDPLEADAAAATVLTRPKYLYSDDVSVKQRAESALKLLGGEKALQTLMGQKSEVLRTYNDLLAKADEPIQELFKETMRQAQRSFAISQWMSIIIFGIGVGTIIAGLAVAFVGGQTELQRIFGASASLVAVIAVVLDLLVRDPHKRVQEATSVLLRIKVIFLGYMRQIHQLDATFKHEFIEGKDFGAKETQETVKQITDVMKITMDMIDLHLPVRKTEKMATEEVLKSWQEHLDAVTKQAGAELAKTAGTQTDGQNPPGAEPAKPAAQSTTGEKP